MSNAHAEESIVAWALESDCEVVKIAASSKVCPDICEKLVLEIFPNATIVTPISGKG